MKTAAVLLNYNDADSAIAAAERILRFSSLSEIILVDNGSSDGSGEKISSYIEEKIFEGTAPERLVFLQNKKNGGYGYGNNRGVKRAAEDGCEAALIANPDVSFSEDTVKILKEALASEDVAAAGALMEGRKMSDCAWPLGDFTGELRFNGPVTKRIFHSQVIYPDSFFENLPREVGAVHGSLFLVKTADFLAAGGFDERFFLFCEEKVLAKRLQAIGKKEVLTNARYSHEESKTLRNLGMKAVSREVERQKSELLYYKYYCGADEPQIVRARRRQKLVLLETKVYSILKR